MTRIMLLENDRYLTGQQASESASITSNECSARGHEQLVDAITLITRQRSVSLRCSGAVSDQGRTVSHWQMVFGSTGIGRRIL